MAKCLRFVILLNNLLLIFCDVNNFVMEYNPISVGSYVFWPNATIPFYIHPDHFDHEQSLAIMTSLSMFAFKSCIKFVPVMAHPDEKDHALVFVNPDGKRRCVLDTDGHSVFEPHTVTLGYECLRSPLIDMMIMKALGFPFEHNRASRDVFIEVLMENIEPGAMELFTKDPKLPLELRNLPYDVNSVMHFGNRDYSKNGHKTIMFKDHKVQQNRVGLTTTDLRKIEIVYGPECLKRDRQEKIDLCQSYPGVVRRKRNAEVVRSLRINPNITPPPLNNDTQNVDNVLIELGIENEVQEIVEHLYKVSALALKNARYKYCNNTKPDLRTGHAGEVNKASDILGIVGVVIEYAKSVVDDALKNLTEFCESSKSMDVYQRARCPYDDGSWRCRQTYRSTKSGPVRHSTQHRPTYYRSTHHRGSGYKHQYDKIYRAGNLNESQVDSVFNGTDVDEVTAETTTIEGKRRDSQVTSQKDSGDNKRRRKRNADKQPEGVSDDKSKANSQITNAEEANGQAKRELQVLPLIVNVDTENTAGNLAESPANPSNSSANGTTLSEMKSRRHANDKRSHKGRRFRSKYLKLGKPEVDSDESNVSVEETKNQKRIRENKEQDAEESDVEVDKRMERHDRLTKKVQQKKTETKNRSFQPKTVPLSKLNREFYDERKWPGGVVPYMIEEVNSYDLQDMRKRIEEVNSILRKKTCVKLQEITENEARHHRDYLVIDTSPDYVTGRVGGRQSFGCLELFRGGQHRQHAAMMVMAMLGFYFEVARHDRDKHVRVHMRHVRADKLHHFEKIRDEATLPLPYDYRSATHPAWQFWRKIGKTGISTVATYKEQDPDGSVMKTLGQNEELLSESDIIKINSVYGVKCFHNERSKTKENIENVEHAVDVQK